LKFLKSIVLGVTFLIGLGISTVGAFALISAVQAKLFLPEEYLLAVSKYPFSNIAFIYEVYFIVAFIFVFNKDYRKSILEVGSINRIVKKHKKPFILAFTAINIVLLYAIVFNITVVTENKIIDHTFLSPQGKEYGYSDIVKIDTGVYGKKRKLLFNHFSTGDFYYIIQLKDGVKINITDERMIIENDGYKPDPRFIIEKLDSQFVEMGISKKSSMDNFEYCTKNLDKIYTDKIRNIILNK
jgi:hypothetical protein